MFEADAFAVGAFDDSRAAPLALPVEGWEGQIRPKYASARPAGLGPDPDGENHAWVTVDLERKSFSLHTGSPEKERRCREALPALLPALSGALGLKVEELQKEDLTYDWKLP